MVRVISAEQRGPEARVRRFGQREDLFQVLGLGPRQAFELSFGQEFEPIVRSVAIEVDRVDVGLRHLREDLADGMLDAGAPKLAAFGIIGPGLFSRRPVGTERTVTGGGIPMRGVEIGERCPTVAVDGVGQRTAEVVAAADGHGHTGDASRHPGR